MLLAIRLAILCYIEGIIPWNWRKLYVDPSGVMYEDSVSPMEVGSVQESRLSLSISHSSRLDTSRDKQ